MPVSGEAVAGNVLGEVELILRYVGASDGRVCGVFWCKLCQFVGWKLVLMQVATRESERGRREATNFRLPQPLPPSLASIAGLENIGISKTVTAMPFTPLECLQ